MNCLLKLLRNFKETFKSKSPRIRDKLSGAVIYVARLTGENGRYGCAKPCQNCAKRLKKFGIRRIKFTDNVNGENVLREMILD